MAPLRRAPFFVVIAAETASRDGIDGSAPRERPQNCGVSTTYQSGPREGVIFRTVWCPEESKDGHLKHWEFSVALT